MAGVGSKVVFEDDRVKVWEFNLEPGEQTPLHTHELDYVFYVIDGAPLEVFDADDNDLGTLDLKSGEVVPIRVEGDELVVINNPSRRVPGNALGAQFRSKPLSRALDRDEVDAFVTEELFRNDAYLKATDATIDSIVDGAIVLNQSVFYPEGGGQPGDRGVLRFSNDEEIAIVDARHGPNGSILHLPAEGAALPQPGIAVRAEIDWEHRYRHMRTHTCLHLLCSLIPFPVTGGSISQDKGRLDFDMTETIDKPTIEEALQRLITEDHPVAFRWITDDEMSANMELVRTMSVAPPMGTGQVRLVDVEGVDLQPCGGTHVARTGEIGGVRIGKVEKKGKHNRRVNLHLD